MDNSDNTPPNCEENSESQEDEHQYKHPLENTWKYWYYKNDRSKDWTSNLSEIGTFDSIEDFWAMYHHLQLPSQLQMGCDYCVFKDGIRPMWEDDKNKRGGRWLISLNKHSRATILDDYWRELMICLVGEAFEESGKIINGVVIQIRPKGDKICIWTSDSQSSDHNINIGRILKERLGIPREECIAYESHNDTQSKSGSTAKCLYRV